MYKFPLAIGVNFQDQFLLPSTADRMRWLLYLPWDAQLANCPVEFFPNLISYLSSFNRKHIMPFGCGETGSGTRLHTSRRDINQEPIAVSMMHPCVMCTLFLGKGGRVATRTNTICLLCCVIPPSLWN